MKKHFLLLSVVLSALFILVGSAAAQSYSFRLDQSIIDVFWNADGTSSINYLLTFTNDPYGAPIDFVDVGLPNARFVDGSIQAAVNGSPIYNISRSDYQGDGDAGVAIALGSDAIRPGETGQVQVFIGTQNEVLYPDTEGDGYASAVFSPTWFGSEFINGTTDMQVTFHLPPGVQPEEPRWHSAPPGFPSEPETALDENGNVTYTWRNSNADGSKQYMFGASFPESYVPETAIVRTSWFEGIAGVLGSIIFGMAPGSCFFFFFAVIVGLSILSSRSGQRRRLQYLPPKISIEGHGIKRGLTAVEAAILMEQPLDKIFTMMLFSTIKKNAVRVKQREPLKIQVLDLKAEGLQTYEVQFLEAMSTEDAEPRKKKLQTTIIDLVNGLSNKMKGFSRSETIQYYKAIVNQAWVQVEAAGTPEVKSERFDENLEWTMLDKDYDRRTRDVFHTGPVFVPTWWGRYDPSFPARASVGTPIPSASSPTSINLPNLPGADFAASVVNGVQNFSGGVIGNLSSFTEGITQKTNPVPVSTSSRSGGSRSGGSCVCACACACAGCACACAGGGR
jgi:hypothetical protein